MFLHSSAVWSQAQAPAPVSLRNLSTAEVMSVLADQLRKLLTAVVMSVVPESAEALAFAWAFALAMSTQSSGSYRQVLCQATCPSGSTSVAGLALA